MNLESFRSITGLQQEKNREAHIAQVGQKGDLRIRELML